VCHCEAVERAEAIPVAMKAMFLTAEEGGNLGLSAIAIKAIFLTQSTRSYAKLNPESRELNGSCKSGLTMRKHINWENAEK
jgi:hypothetical protein